MDTAVVKLDALADTVGSATEHHDFFLIGRLRFALVTVGGIHVGGVGRKLRRAGVHPLEDWADIGRVSLGANCSLSCFEQLGQTAVRKAFALEGAQLKRRNFVEGSRFQLQLNFDDLFNLHQEPRVDFGQGKHFVHTHALAKGVADIPNTVRAGFAKLFFEHFAVLGFFVQAIDADFQAAQGFLERLLESAANRHHLADRLHLGGQTAVSCGKFFKRETWNFGDHVVDARLETRRRGTARNFVT